MAKIRLSVIIPAFDEAERLPGFLEGVVCYLEQEYAGQWEVLVVDDGSTDDTADRAAQIVGADSVLRLPVNQGKGAAVRRGMLAAWGDVCLFADADGATPIEEERRLRAALEQGADVAIGSRWGTEGTIRCPRWKTGRRAPTGSTTPENAQAVRRFCWTTAFRLRSRQAKAGTSSLVPASPGQFAESQWPTRSVRSVSAPRVENESRNPQSGNAIVWEVHLRRVVMGRVFNWLTQRMLGLDYQDTQCGFKMFRREAAQRIFRECRLRGFGFDVEVLYLAGKLGLKVAEVAVNWHDVAGSKVRLVRDSVAMAREVWMTRKLHGGRGRDKETRGGGDKETGRRRGRPVASRFGCER